MSSSGSSSTPGQTIQLHCSFCPNAEIPCPPDCLFRPYFPNDDEHMTDFQNVLKLFGRENVLNLLTELQPHQRDDVMKTIVSEANEWEAQEAKAWERSGRRDVEDTILEGNWRLKRIRQRLGLEKPSYERCAACAIENQMCITECPFRNLFPNDDEENRTAYIKFKKVFKYANVFSKVMRFKPEERDQKMNKLLDHARELTDQDPPGESSMSARALLEAWKILDNL